MMLFEKISSNIASSIAETLKVDNDKQEVIAYGAYVALDTMLSLGVVMLLGAIFGVFIEALIFSFVAALFRKTSGGAHATTSIRCATIFSIVAVGFALIVKNLVAYINVPIVIVCLIVTFAISYYLVFKLAPKDSPNKPIVKETKIKELKAKSIKTLCIYALICLLMLVFGYYTETQAILPYIVLICTGYLWQAFTLTSLGHSFTYMMEAPFRYINYIGGENK